MSGPTDVVIAGSKPFALALFAPVTERAGSRPRIAPEPATALTLCAESSGVLVVEYEPRWLPALVQLRRSRPGLRVVAALPRGQEAAAGELSPLSIETVLWDGQARSVLPAIERAIGGPADPAPSLPAAESPEEPTLDLFKDLGARTATPFPASLAAVLVPAAMPSPSQPSPEPETLDLFKDLGGGSLTPFPASLKAVPAMSMTVRPAGAAWPADGPSAAEAEQALRAALAAGDDGTPLGAVADRTAAGLSPLEREVFAGGTLEVDAGLIRRAAVLRLRVAVALATRPPKGTVSDVEAVAELLSEIDGLLASVKGLLAGASPEVKVSLEAIRNALVKEAVDFSEACHEVGTAELPLAQAAARGAGRAAGAKVLSVHAGVDQEDRPEEQRRRVMPAVLLLVVLAVGGGYHAWNYSTAPTRQPPATFEGAPAGTMAVQNGKAYLLVELPGQKVNAAALEAYRQREAKRGNQVREIGPGTWIIEPAHAGGGGTP
jgi:hypothetical protein